MPENHYHVALSYASEQGEYVSEVASILKSKNVRCFYDKDKEISLWGKSIPEALQKVFERGESNLVVIFISQEYVTKPFPKIELQYILSQAIDQKYEYILPARFEQSVEVPGLPGTVKYIDLRDKTPEHFAEMIIAKMNEQGIYFGQNTSTEETHVLEISKKDGSKMTLIIKDESEAPVYGTDVYRIHQNGTRIANKSDETGEVTFPIDVGREVFYTIFIAHKEFLACIIDNFRGNTDIEITLKKENGIGSTIFSQDSGYIHGIEGRLNPTLGSSKQPCLYADNIAINGGTIQPAYFEFGKNINLVDCHDKMADIRIHRIIQRCTILDYIMHEKG